MADEEAIKEFREFAQITAEVLQDHKQTLQRHEENFVGAFHSAESHKVAIEELRQHLRSLAAVINEQSVVMAQLQKMLSNLGAAKESEKIN